MNFLGIFFTDHRFFYIELTKIYGIGLKTSIKICKEFNIYNKRVKEIDNINKIKVLKKLKKFNIGLDLKKIIFYNIKRLIRINSYRGSRHLKKLPTRGQRTRTNSKTSRKRL
ncbi:30S ribosomal protein S13 [Candidatus Vidania fulgoroideorum]